ncbi:MAG TPA: hypothetical protein VFL61_09400 [Gaiellaceae bacterium]|nr:hypothetical protein [Gaiellaceae bacterium]
MSTSESLEALRRANPRAAAGFAQSVEAAAGAVRARIDAGTPDPVTASPRRRVRLVRLVAAGAVLAAAAGVAASTIESPRGGPGVEDAAAAVRKAATVTAAAAQRSGTAVVRITHNGEVWAGTTIRWHGRDLAVSRDAPQNPLRKAGDGLLVVGGTVYGRDPRTGDWLAQGTPANIDPGSGTTPAEYLAAVREDVGGVTLRRIAGGLTGLTSSRLDGSTVYRGSVAAGMIARETGFKEGQTIRVFPFGYVAHDEAADPNALLDAEVTVGAEGVVREIALSWGRWTYTVTYLRLGATPQLVAPKNARDLVKERLRAVGGE